MIHKSDFGKGIVQILCQQSRGEKRVPNLSDAETNFGGEGGWRQEGNLRQHSPEIKIMIFWIVMKIQIRTWFFDFERVFFH